MVSMRAKIGLFLGPLLFALCIALPAFAGFSGQAKGTAAVAVLMATWWITEAIPIPVTALLPLLLFPLLGIMTAKDVSMRYADQNIFLFMGGFFIAMAMQRWNLHKRIALYIVRLLGTSPNRIILGFMVSTAFLSMWISNTATAMMMFPIGLAVIYHAASMLERDKTEIDTTPGHFNFGTGLMLGIAYSASIGGIATLVGTPPNIVFAGIVKSMFPKAPEIGFLDWLKIGFPLVLVLLPLTWFYLTRIAVPPKIKRIPGGKDVIERDLRELGRIGPGEKLTLFVFIAVALAWIFRGNIDIGVFVVPGWTDLLGISAYVHDSTIAMAGAILLFLLPVDIRRRTFVLNWEWALRIPWGIILLFGGGFALAAGFQASGLAQWIGESLSFLHGVPVIIMILIICLLLTFLTEVTSNTATATMMMPVLGALAVATGAHPFLLMIPATMSASCAFMLPVATPPNAIIFGSGYLRIPDMARVGFSLNIIGAIVITILVYFLAIPIFGIRALPLPF
ncbi:MAG: SLC13/DASS family transporter [candidate division WOR-3 bacterium]|nr:MAG: SLC13/DASS family transporter [candidate division WOR-3 bacterium]